MSKIAQEESHLLNELHKAAFSGDISLSKKLLESGIDVNTTNPEFDNGKGLSILHYAVAGGHSSAINTLLSFEGINVNIPDHINMLPIHLAVLQGSLNIVRKLLEEGASVNSINDKGCTPLFYAVFHGHPDVAMELLEKGADTLLGGREDFCTPLHLAVQKRSTDFLKLLLKYSEAHKFPENSIKLFYDLIEASVFNPPEKTAHLFQEKNIKNSIIINKSIMIGLLDKFFNKHDTFNKLQTYLKLSEEEIAVLYILNPEGVFNLQDMPQEIINKMFDKGSFVKLLNYPLINNQKLEEADISKFYNENRDILNLDNFLEEIDNYKAKLLSSIRELQIEGLEEKNNEPGNEEAAPLPPLSIPPKEPLNVAGQIHEA